MTEQTAEGIRVRRGLQILDGSELRVGGSSRFTTLEIVVPWLAGDDNGIKLLAANAFAHTVAAEVRAAGLMAHDGGGVTRVTLQTIADHLGVSRTTISNAYNRPDQLGDDLRERILETATRLGYRGPDAAGRMLRTGRMGAIGLLFTEDLRFVFTDPDTTRFMQGVAETSALAGTGLMLLPVLVGVEVSDTAVASAAVDGYLVFSVADGHPALETILRRGVPVVVVDEPDLGQATSFVGIDDRSGAKMAAGHLLGLGHRRLGVLLGRTTADGTSGPLSRERLQQATVRIARERMMGYEAAVIDAGLAPETLVAWEAGGNDPDSGRRARPRDARRPPRHHGSALLQ